MSVWLDPCAQTPRLTSAGPSFRVTALAGGQLSASSPALQPQPVRSCALSSSPTPRLAIDSSGLQGGHRGRPTRRTRGGVYVIQRDRLNPDAGFSDKSLPGPAEARLPSLQRDCGRDQAVSSFLVLRRLRRGASGAMGTARCACWRSLTQMDVLDPWVTVGRSCSGFRAAMTSKSSPPSPRGARASASGSREHPACSPSRQSLRGLRPGPTAS